MISTFSVHEFLDEDSETFTYVVVDNTTSYAVIIDPVLDFDYKSGRTDTHSAQRVLHWIERQNLTVKWILETHAHADHLSAASFLRDSIGGQIGIGEHITQVQDTFKTIFNLEPNFLPNGSQFDRLFKHDDLLQVGNMSIRIMHTPGHTPADLAYIVNEQAAFVGDTIFMPDVGTARCDFPGGDANTLYDSIQTLFSLPDSTDIYVCHDYPPEGRDHQCNTQISQQKQHNIHVNDNMAKADFVDLRQQRDATLPMPRLILPAIQINIRAGQMPTAEANGTVYLKIPINLL
ncbi:MBL fold metallo-hydrolase [Shewanella livingstonensis]|uniref:MBL fold metallo-hydrolase n=1 Tax=Shewanella livingstonensis TaxID=150120 RepID=A0A3G8M1F5_9GAMM|nr:MBL fold metallo-hydrolase [Shewanella livingstonensis]AZG75175.1 MBL fold metallo-hydrolase [Shewanella livingstonensis]